MTKCEKFFYGMDRRLGKLMYDGEITLETKRAVMASLRYDPNVQRYKRKP